MNAHLRAASERSNSNAIVVTVVCKVSRGVLRVVVVVVVVDGRGGGWLGMAGSLG